MLREFALTVYVLANNRLEASMYEPRMKRSFLKRVIVPDLRLEDLRAGNVVTIFARQMKVKSYNDNKTRVTLEAKLGAFCLLTAPSFFPRRGEIICHLQHHGFGIGRLRLVSEGGPVVAIEAVGSDAEERCQQVLDQLGECVRRVSPEEMRHYFEDKPTTALYDSCTLCVIRPHALKEGNAGPIIAAIQESGFEISAAKTISLAKAEVEELLDVYKGVIPYYTAMIDSMITAPCLALELRKGGGVVPDFRELCGPHDVEIAKHLRPESLRAKFGRDNIQNAVHCTDLEEDGEIETRFLFEMLVK
jgi:nucleoside-diphosphate kinase